jgi:hypothetical protein
VSDFGFSAAQGLRGGLILFLAIAILELHGTAIDLQARRH